MPVMASGCPAMRYVRCAGWAESRNPHVSKCQSKTVETGCTVGPDNRTTEIAFHGTKYSPVTPPRAHGCASNRLNPQEYPGAKQRAHSQKLFAKLSLYFYLTKFLKMILNIYKICFRKFHKQHCRFHYHSGCLRESVRQVHITPDIRRER